MPQSAELSVAIYEESDKKLAHWAIHLRVVDGGDDDFHHFVYQANENAEGRLELDISEVDPANTIRLKRLVFVAMIDGEGTIREVKQTIAQQPIRHDIVTWNCQDYVLETLSTLHDKEYLQDYEYDEAKATLEDLFYN
ncbi:uncharacterized protein TRAVEDRAFT_19274 [Trametes versicolor FP-101664 SS1]|uniref:uncharacterized protein n=1 Tax=Trametes versicolor (strain FP-101664) TaxID=717944 RepID=UPI00046236F7|nr:uncharacterized protein TRAVEDRAFT_19274 [Trametes versicolor FP-101664 SS1]EIW60646.1 hypothetical protein TRAVEDRAFT_19274 [Trametes versicolor FP-101664 SS1]